MTPAITEIYHWYNRYKRDLPWRESRDSYRIWLSEIILQQTRVEQGLRYYEAFTDRFPTVFALAEANEDEVLKLWQGLGYYSRARNLHKTAKKIANEYNGLFPGNFSKLIELPGIGEYTAAAISSIAFGEEKAAVDGNVYRVLSRIYGIATPIDSSAGKREFLDLANQLIRGSEPGTHNQALMEFGALHCVPSAPDCETCPVSQYCIARQTEKVRSLPVKAGKTRQRNRYFHYLVICHNDSTFLTRRTAKDIWQNLFEFPLIETQSTKLSSRRLVEEITELTGNRTPLTLRHETNWKIHLLSHQRIHYRFLIFEAKEIRLSTRLVKVNKKDIFNFATPKLTENFLQEYDWFWSNE